MLACGQSQAQMGVGIAVAHPNAALDVTSSNGGLLVSRVTSTNRDAMTNVPIGLLIYNTTADSFQYYTGNGWINMNAGGNEWVHTGNNGAALNNSFLGTQDNIDFRIKTNNADRLVLSGNGAVGMSQPAPSNAAILDLAGAGGVRPPRLPNDVPNPSAGLIYYNTSNNALRLFTGGLWNATWGVGSAIVDNTQASTVLHSYNNSTNVRSQFIMRKANGTPSAWLPVASNEQLGALRFAGYDGAGFTTGAAITAHAEGAVSVGSIPTRMDFKVMNSAGALNTPISITSDNNIGINKSNPTNALEINGTFGLLTGNAAATGSATVIFASSGVVSLPAAAPATIRRTYIIRNTSTTNNVQVGSVVDFNSTSPTTITITPAMGSIMVHCNDAFSGVRRWVRVW